MPEIVEYGQMCVNEGGYYNSIFKVSELPSDGLINAQGNSQVYIAERLESAIWTEPVQPQYVDLARKKYFRNVVIHILNDQEPEK